MISSSHSGAKLTYNRALCVPLLWVIWGERKKGEVLTCKSLIFYTLEVAEKELEFVSSLFMTDGKTALHILPALPILLIRSQK